MSEQRTTWRSPKEAFDSPEAAAFKQEIVDAGRKLWIRQYVDGNGGNISCRLTDEWVLSTPTLVSKADLQPSDICLVDMSGEQLAGTRKRSSEILLHLEIYRNVPAAGAVVHCHPPHATAYSLAGAVPPECMLAEHEVFVGPVAIVPYQTPGTQAFADTIRPLVQRYNTVLLANHGLVTWADTVTHAEWYVEVTDTTCRVLMLASHLGQPLNHIPADLMDGLLSLKRRLGMPDVRFSLDESLRFPSDEGPGSIAAKPRSADGALPGTPRHAAPGSAADVSTGGTGADPRYPVGRFDPSDATPLREIVSRLERFPAELRAVVTRLTDTQLATAYRDGGWTARQVVHHLADSHLNSAIRFRLALTEDRPTIKPYDEKAWAELEEAAHGPVETSLRLIEGLHARWVALLEGMGADDWKRTFVHPERGEMDLERTARLYAWHCDHHLAHIRIAVRRAS
jgi:L-fuculose-phosphate aldolase